VNGEAQRPTPITADEVYEKLGLQLELLVETAGTSSRLASSCRGGGPGSRSSQAQEVIDG
jgi:hypothetical protein